MARNFDDTLKRVLEQIPEGETKQFLAAEGKKVSTSLSYAPPEDQAIHWLRFANALAAAFPVLDTPWKEKIHEIMTSADPVVLDTSMEEVIPSTLEEYEKHEGCPSGCTPERTATFARAARTWQAQTKLPEADREFRVFRSNDGGFVIERRFEFDIFLELVFEKEPDPPEYPSGWEEVPIVEALTQDGKRLGVSKAKMDALVERTFHFMSQCRENVVVPKDWKLLCAARDDKGEIHFAINEILDVWAKDQNISLWGLD